MLADKDSAEGFEIVGVYLMQNSNPLFEVIVVYNRIRDLREYKDLNQTKVAKMLGMSQTGYSKYVTGENDIPTAVLIKLADFYNVSIDYILVQTDNPKRNK